MVGLYASGEKVFAKVKGYPPWPARIDYLQDSVKSPKQKYAVFFYGTHEIAFLGPEKIYPYEKFKDKYHRSNNRDSFKKGMWEILNNPDVVFSPETSVKSNQRQKKRKHEENDVHQPAAKLRRVDSEYKCKKGSSTISTRDRTWSLSPGKEVRESIGVNNSTPGNKQRQVETSGEGIKVERNNKQHLKSNRSGDDKDAVREPSNDRKVNRVLRVAVRRKNHKSQEGSKSATRSTSNSVSNNSFISTPSTSCKSVEKAVSVKCTAEVAGRRRETGQLPVKESASAVGHTKGRPKKNTPSSLKQNKRKQNASTVAHTKGRRGRPKKNTASSLKQNKTKEKGKSHTRKNSVKLWQNKLHPKKHASHQRLTLLEAVKMGDVLAVSDFLSTSKQIVHHTNNVYNEALILASQLGHKRIIQLLLNRGAYINVSDFKYGTPLIAAVRNGYLDIVKFLLATGANVNIEHASGETALLFAVENAHSTQIVESLISHGASVNSQNKHGRTAALASVEKCDFDMLKVLIDRDADFTIADVSGNTALKMASDKHCLDLVELLLESKDSPNISPLERAVARNSVDMVRILLDCNFVDESKSTWSRSILAKALGKGCIECHAKDTTNPEIIRLLVRKGANLHGEYDGNLPLNLAAASGSLELVQLLVGGGADVNVSDRSKSMTPLMHAAKHGHLDVLKYLIEVESCIDIIANFEMTALSHALKHGHIECARLLLATGARINVKHDSYICVECNQYESLKFVVEHVDFTELDDELLFVAVQDGFCEMAELLIDCRMNVNAVQVSGEAVLMQASTKEMAEMLIRKGADVNMAVCEYGTPLIYFSSYDADVTTRDNIVDVLIRNGAKVDGVDKCGYTALIKAAFHEREGAVHLLTSARADVNQANDQGQTALMMAAQKGNTNIMRMLLKNGARVNEQDTKDKQTALMFACMNSYMYAAQLLLDKGAVVDLADEKGNTALLLTTDEDVIELLVSRGADVNRQNKSGKTCLIFAAWSKKVSMVKKLIYLGADVCVVNEVEKETALTSVMQTVVLRANEYNCIEALLEAGAAKVCPLHCDVTLARLIIDNNRRLVHMFVTNGAVPSTICMKCLSKYNCFHKGFCARVEESISELSPLAVSLICGNTDIASYLASNWFLTKSDLMIGSLCSLENLRPVLQELLRHESLSLLDIFCLQPSSLAKLSFVSVLDLLGPASGREVRINSSGLPLLLQQKLLFKNELVPLQDSPLETHGLSLKVIDLLPHHYSPSPTDEYFSSSDEFNFFL